MSIAMKEPELILFIIKIKYIGIIIQPHSFCKCIIVIDANGNISAIAVIL